MMDKYESIYEFSKHSENFHKFNNFDFYSGEMAKEFGIIKTSYLEVYSTSMYWLICLIYIRAHTT